MRVLVGGLVTGALGRCHLVRGARELPAHQSAGPRLRSVGSGGQDRRLLVLPQREGDVHDVRHVEGALVGRLDPLVGPSVGPLEGGRGLGLVRATLPRIYINTEERLG